MYSDLYGPRAFYNNPEYPVQMRRDFTLSGRLPVSYEWNPRPSDIEDTEWRIVKCVRYIFHVIAAWAIVPASFLSFFASFSCIVSLCPTLSFYNTQNLRKLFCPLAESFWKCQRTTISADGNDVDTVLMINSMNPNPKKWMVAALGNGQLYEGTLHPLSQLREVAEHAGCNLIVFNYPGVGESSGFCTREAMENACLGVINFVEEKAQADELILYGHSIGGGVLADAFARHERKEGVNYTFVASRTFSDLSTLVSKYSYEWLGSFVQMIGWDIHPASSLENLPVPTVVLQTASNQDGWKVLQNSSELAFTDKIILKEASLAGALLKPSQREDLICVGIPETHNVPFRDPSLVSTYIEEARAFRARRQLYA